MHFTDRRKAATLGLSIVLMSSVLVGQRFVDPNKGNIIYTKKGIMDGNFVRTIFYNHGEIAHWPDQPSGEWPKGSGHTYVDGVAVIVQAETQDLSGNTIHPLETNYREFIRKDPVSKIPWGWEPLTGYANPTQDQPAMSNNPDTWPAYWPDRALEWSGYWNGFFGRGIQNADLETYYRMDDAADKQYAYRPDPADTARGGLGLQVAVRGFQWSQVLAADVIFWFYEITSIAVQDYTKTIFAQYVDWGIGGTQDSSDDRGLFDTELDIAWAFDGDGIGQPGNWSPVGLAGYAFLESPGIATNGADDDLDGIVDERRDNSEGVKIVGRNNIVSYMNANYNMSRFLAFYNYSIIDDIPAVQQGYWWTGDENANWKGFTDLNGNGSWDEGEPLNDDVGSDGLGPFDNGYPGPDPDGSQGDGKPEQGEPNFGILDKDESDQIGLTGFSIFPVHFYELLDDEQNWQVLSTPIDPSAVRQLNDVNLGMYFSAGARAQGTFPGNLFPLRQGQTERFSMALLFGMDRDDLFRRKKTIQQIYNANYRFAKPPEKPRLVAVPGDRRVVLYWDSRAERSYDPFLQKFDFEGYRIYRSTEPNFLENFIITDAYGKSTFRKPLAQYDLIDSIKGLHPIDINGVKFDLGNDTGLRHTYVDTDIQNGQTYYYAVVSYDQGFYTTTTTGKLDGIAPSECTSIIRTDINGNVKIDINTAMVVPRAPSAGFISSGVDGQILHAGPGTGTFDVQVLNPDSIRAGHVYRISFENHSAFQNDPAPYFTLTDETDNRIVESTKRAVARLEETAVIDGFIGYVSSDPKIDVIHAKSKWIVGDTNVVVKTNSLQFDPGYQTVAVAYPADFEIRFSGSIVDTSTQTGFFDTPTPVKFSIWNGTESKKAQFVFQDNNNDSTFSPGNRIIIVTGDSLGKEARLGNYRAAWMVEMFTETLAGPLRRPAPGDIYRIVTGKPFRTGESFQFKMRVPAEDKEKAKSELDKIAVVPNPYVGAASWEPQNLFRSGRGERKVFFVNLPSSCTIRIYTVSGSLVKEIQHTGSFDNGQESWNLVSKDGMDISYGIYVFHIEAPGIGEQIGKLAIIK